VIVCLKEELHPEDQQGFGKLITMTLKAGCIGMALLAFIYVGMSYVAAFYGEQLSHVPQDELIGALSLQVLGRFGGGVTVLAVSLACLTTAMALAAVFAEFLHEDIFLEKVSYHASLVMTLLATFLMSTLDFEGIMSILGPMLKVCYPALVVLSILNIFYKIYGFRPVKIPVLIVFILTLVFYALL